MTRKSKKGIVGKYPMASKRKGSIGPGIDFVSENLTSGPEIESKVKEKMGD